MKIGNIELHFGPLEPLMADDKIMEIMINSPKQIYIESHGNLVQTDVSFTDEDHLRHVISGIALALGVQLHDQLPLVDLRLPDGSRMNIVLPPVAVSGMAVTIRRIVTHDLRWDDLLRFGAVNEQQMRLLRAIVVANQNICIAGGTGSGKTTIYNALTEFIPGNERIVTVERATELRVRHEHVITLECRTTSADGTGEVTMHDLVINAMKMRPDRILIGEVAGDEIIDALTVMNNGYDGSMFSLHATSVRDVFARLETLALMNRPDLPLLMIREQLASALNIIILQQRLKDGTRRIMKIAEVTGFQGGEIVTQDIAEYVIEGEDEAGNIIGHHQMTGYIPQFSLHLRGEYALSADFFTS